MLVVQEELNHGEQKQLESVWVYHGETFSILDIH